MSADSQERYCPRCDLFSDGKTCFLCGGPTGDEPTALAHRLFGPEPESSSFSGLAPRGERPSLAARRWDREVREGRR